MLLCQTWGFHFSDSEACGSVSQGYVIGLLLFLLYINDLADLPAGIVLMLPEATVSTFRLRDLEAHFGYLFGLQNQLHLQK